MFERLTLWDDANKCWVEDHSRDTREWKNGHNACMNRLAAYEDSGLTPEQVQELAKAKAEGRLMVLPCKVEDTVYRPDGIYPWYIEHIEIYGDEIIFVDDSDNIFTLDDIGKTVFLTREEAEKALQEVRE